MSRGGRGRRNLAREARVVEAIEQYVARERVPPTLEELAELVGCSVPTLHKFVARLEEQGRLSSLWVAGKRSPRALRVEPAKQVALPLSPIPRS